MTVSWTLKLDRAEHHLAEVDSYVTQYAESHPYGSERIEGDSEGDDQEIVRHLLRFTDQPDERLAVVVGDVIHNLRSALDHLMVAILPDDVRRNPWAAFPIFPETPFDDDGRPLNTTGRTLDVVR